MKRKEYEEDDGETVVNMNIDGMPWYSVNSMDGVRGAFKRGEREEYKRKDSSAGMTSCDGRQNEERQVFTAEEEHMYCFAALKAGLLIVLLFGGVFAAFIALCDFVLFR